VTVLESGIRAVDLAPGDGERALQRMRDAGADVDEGPNAPAGATAPHVGD
jgi:hypothetical protein